MEKKLDIITKEQAIKLKELGFDWYVLQYYMSSVNKVWGGNFVSNYNNPDVKIWEGNDIYYSAPTIDLALKWLRDVKGMNISVHPTHNADGIIYMCSVFYIKDTVYHITLKEEPLTIDYTPPQIFEKYEYAQLAGLNEVINILNKEKNETENISLSDNK